MSGPGRVLVTGGAGFIGSHVVDAFLDAGHDVRVADDLSGGRRENVDPRATFDVLDIRSAVALSLLVREFEPAVVCHLAAQASVTVSVRDPTFDLNVNVQGTLNVLEAARSVGARVVFASTGGALYGENAPMPTREEFDPQPLSPYGASKLAGEAYLGTWARLYEMPNVILRLGNVYGPRQDAHGEAGVVAIFSTLLRSGEVPTVFGDGKQTRDYIYVADVAQAFLAVSATSEAGTYNVGTGSETDVLTLLEHLQVAAGTNLSPQFEPLRPGELTRSALDHSALSAAVSWSPATTVSTGLAETYASYTT